MATTPELPERGAVEIDPLLTLQQDDPTLPDWGRVLWERYWLLQAQTDRHAAQISRQAATIHHLKEQLVAAQVDVDALTAQVQTIDTAVNDAVNTLTADNSAIQAEIAALQAANPQLDLSGLQAAVAQAATDVQNGLGAAVAGVTALVPPAPSA